MEECKLCGKKAKLRISHIIPKFVNRYIKETSLTGYLRGSPDINKRSQDGIKAKLLCDDCETKLSDWERQFADIFQIHNYSLGSGQGLIKIEYDSSLISFIISLFWRVIVATQITGDIKPSNMMFIRNLEQKWADFLNGKRSNWGDCEFHMIFLDEVNHKYISNFPKHLNTYVLRTWECGAYDVGNVMGIFIKLPGVLLLCSIAPPILPGLIETKINDHGTMYTDKQIVHNEMIGLILLGRSLAVEKELSKLTPQKYKKIEDEATINFIKKLENLKKIKTVMNKA